LEDPLEPFDLLLFVKFIGFLFSEHLVGVVMSLLFLNLFLVRDFVFPLLGLVVEVVANFGGLGAGEARSAACFGFKKLLTCLVVEVRVVFCLDLIKRGVPREPLGLRKLLNPVFFVSFFIDGPISVQVGVLSR
jgi:hypothetical protein